MLFILHNINCAILTYIPNIQDAESERAFMKVAFYTLGCKVNQYETQMLEGMFAGEGYEIVSHEEQADLYVVNSCTVTAQGDRKTRQILRRFKKQNPGAKVALTGCFPQAFPDAAAKIPEADIIAGNRSRSGFVKLAERAFCTGERIIEIVPHQRGEPFEGGYARSSERTRAFVKIEDGCERYCAYCIIPTARGPVRSKPLAEISLELEQLAREGYREAVLTGINLSCYGKEYGLRLADAVEAACKTSISRVRLGSLEPELLEPGQIDRLAAQKKLCPQFHMSLQSGCNATLRRMKRHYTAEEYAGIVADLRKKFPHCAITTDIMAGFPGETEEEFMESLAFAKKTGFAKAHIFAYSPRPGTKAAEMPDQIEASVKNQRAARLSQAMAESRKIYLQSQIGETLQVLFETNRNGIWEGYGENYVPVRVKTTENLQGKILSVSIIDIEEDSCLGQLESAVSNPNTEIF